MTAHLWRRSGRGLEYVTTLRRPVVRPWLPAWQRACWWLVAAFLLVAMTCTYRGW